MSAIAAISAQVDRTTFECVCVVETPKGSRSKWKFDEATGLFKLAYVLPEGLNFPFDFGFIPSTKAEDGDPLDVLVLVDEPGVVGGLMDIRLVGVIKATQSEDGEKCENDRLIAVPVHAHAHKHTRGLDDLSDETLEQIENFFLSYTRLQKKKFKITGRGGPKEAMKRVTQAMKAFKTDDA